MQLELTAERPDGTRHSVTAQLTDDVSVGRLRRSLFGDDGDLWVGPRRLPADAPVAGAGLHTGTVLRTGPVPSAEPAPTGPYLAAIGGLSAGRTAPLAAHAPAVVGRAADCRLMLPDPEVSRHHAAVRLREDGASVEVSDAGSSNGTRWRGNRLAGSAPVDLGDVLGVGETVLQAVAPHEVRADLTEQSGTGARTFNRPPHIAEPRRRPTLKVPAEPGAAKGFRFPWIAVATPMVMAGAMYLVMPQYAGYLMVMMLVSPVMLLANTVNDRRSGRKSHAQAKRDYATALAAHEAALAAAVRADEVASRAADPDPAEVLRRVTTPDARLWQRRRSETDFLRLRVGLGDRPADVALQPSAADQPEPVVPTAHDVPVAVELAKAGVLGVAGPRETALAAVRAMLLHAAALHAPADLALAVITGADTAGDWEWASWLPHTDAWSSLFACRRLVAVDGEQAAARVAELQRIVDERTAEQRALLVGGPPPGRAVLVLLDGARRLRSVPGLARLLDTGPAAGVHALCVDADETALPDECRATIVVDPDSPTRATVRTPGADPRPDVLLDGLTLDLAEPAARALTPLRALGSAGDARAELPDRVRYTELAGLAGTPDEVLRGWQANPGGRSARALLGVADGAPRFVDLVKDGPHALVAGTSGSGKSELLQTLVASLALGNAPDALNFVLVDYKGGSAFASCAELPHCAGLITDLDGHLVTRALDSLSAELRRREALLAAAGAKDITDYWARTGARLPRLVIVVDEFASLVEEVPDFVPGVVGIGMRGRSLGVHVVLATQRPGGTVTADMRANLNLRICLRVTSDTESSDVIDSPAAGRIPAGRAGRGYVRTGHGELTAVQAARIGWPVQDNAAPEDEPIVLRPRRVDTLGRAAETGPAADVDEHGRTDLSELVAAIGTAAASLGLPESPRPWLPPLAEQVPLGAIEPADRTAPVIGLVDRPAAQAQDPFPFDLEATGPVVIGGTVRSGRSTALRTIAAALAGTASPADVHLYALDCGNQALAALADLPHCGAVVDGADEARTERLLALLGDEVARRARMLAAGGHGSLAEQRAAAAPDDRLPRVVVLLDRLEAFVGRYAEANGGALLDRLETLLRTGPSVGVSCVLATDRTGFTHRIGSAVSARLVLRQATPDDAVHFGVDHRAIPTAMPPGRAVWTPTGEEVQLGFVGADPAGGAQLAELRAFGARLARRWDGLPDARRPRRVDPLPESLTAAELATLRVQPRPGGSAVITVGAGGDHLAPVDLDLAEVGGGFVIAGPTRSGRSTALVQLAESLAGSLASALPRLLVAPRPSPLRELPDTAGTPVAVADLAAELETVLADGTPVALVVDDAELLDDRRTTDALERFVRGMRDTGSVLLAAATTEDLLLNRYRGWLAAARRDRCGLLLNPASHVDGEVFDLRLPRSTSGGWPPGRGLFVRGGTPLAVQVPLAATAEHRS